MPKPLHAKRRRQPPSRSYGAAEHRRISQILAKLSRAYPDARCTLDYSNPLELLVATILSAQCTDVLVNKVTPQLFKKYRTANDYARANLATLQGDISRVNFYRNKAKAIKQSCQVIVECFGAQVPNRMEGLLKLPGVARKTANVILGNAFGVAVGIVVDTHVLRVSQRLGLSAQTDRNKVEQDLMTLVPSEQWTKFAHQMILHGRNICKAVKPLCIKCTFGHALCPSYQLQT